MSSSFERDCFDCYNSCVNPDFVSIITEAEYVAVDDDYYSGKVVSTHTSLSKDQLLEVTRCVEVGDGIYAGPYCMSEVDVGLGVFSDEDCTLLKNHALYEVAGFFKSNPYESVVNDEATLCSTGICEALREESVGCEDDIGGDMVDATECEFLSQKSLNTFLVYASEVYGSEKTGEYAYYKPWKHNSLKGQARHHDVLQLTAVLSCASTVTLAILAVYLRGKIEGSSENLLEVDDDSGSDFSSDDDDDWTVFGVDLRNASTTFLRSASTDHL